MYCAVFDFHEAHAPAPPNNSPVHHCIHVSSSWALPKTTSSFTCCPYYIFFRLWRGSWSNLQLFEHECLCRKGVCLYWKGKRQREWRISLPKEKRDRDKGQWMQLHWERFHLDMRKNFFTAGTINNNSLSRDVAEPPWLEVAKMRLDRVLGDLI